MSSLRVGLIGNPVEHSLSPVFQQAGFDALGIDAIYELWLTEDHELAPMIESLRQPGTLGANVTVPHKTGAFRLVGETSELAQRAGAVNTIVNRDGSLFGDNTDIPGFLAPLRQRALSLPECNAVLLGAGGAARGVAVALLSANCGSVTVANRTVERATALRDDVDPSINVTSLGDDLSKILPRTGLLVNSTAIGWDDDATPITREQLALLPSNALVYDLTYKETGLLRAASDAGYDTIDGLPMLVYQGVESFRLWTGQEPPVDVMWRAALDAVRART
jgi:shikimate dehydrogenase